MGSMYLESIRTGFIVSEKNLKLGETIAPDHFVSIGTCFGKFTKTGRFMLHITALNYLAPYAQVCVNYFIINHNIFLLKIMYNVGKFPLRFCDHLL